MPYRYFNTDRTDTYAHKNAYDVTPCEPLEPINAQKYILLPSYTSSLVRLKAALDTLPFQFNPLNPELIPICYLLALLAHHFLHVSRIRVKSLTLRLLMSYIYIYIYICGAPILDVSRSHTTTQHSR